MTNPAYDRIPILEGNDEDRARRLTKMCIRLERMFFHLELSAMVVNVCVMALEEQNAEQDEDIARVLRCFADNKINEQLEKLTKIIEKLGGRTSYTEDIDPSAEALVEVAQ